MKKNIPDPVVLITFIQTILPNDSPDSASMQRYLHEMICCLDVLGDRFMSDPQAVLDMYDLATCCYDALPVPSSHRIVLLQHIEAVREWLPASSRLPTRWQRVCRGQKDLPEGITDLAIYRNRLKH